MLIYLPLAICCLGIVSGSPITDYNVPATPIEKYPYVASIEFDNKYIGGASILSRYFVLTYAMTIWGNPSEHFVVNAGLLSIRVGSNFSKKNGSVHSVCDVKFNWQGGTPVALLQLSDPIGFDAVRQPIRLFNSEDKVKPGAKVSLSAWSNLKNPSVDSPQLEIFDGVVKDNCRKEYYEGAFCIDTPAGINSHGGQGHPVEIDGMQAGIVLESSKGDTHVVSVPIYSKWITETMKQMAKDGKCPGNSAKVNVGE